MGPGGTKAMPRGDIGGKGVGAGLAHPHPVDKLNRGQQGTKSETAGPDDLKCPFPTLSIPWFYGNFQEVHRHVLITEKNHEILLENQKVK